MGIFRTKEDDVLKISTSIFVSNFPDSFSSKDLFHACKQYGHVVDSFITSKRAKDASEDFTLGGRIAWVEVEGISFKLWSGHTFNRIASKWVKIMKVDDYDDTNFYSKRLCILTKVYQNILEGFKIIFRGKVYWMRAKEVPGWTLEFLEEEEEDDVSVEDNHGGIHSDQEINNSNDESDVEEVPETCFNVLEGQNGNSSKDPFGIYPLLNKDKNIREHKINEEESSLKHPSGFTPVGNLNEGHLDGGCVKKVNEEAAGDDNSFVHTVGGKENSGSVNKMSDSMGSCRLKKSGMPRTGGSILSFMEEVVKMNFLSLNVQGLAQKAKKDWVRELCIKNKVNFVGLQETKMESIDLLSVSSCWGNLMSDYVHSDSVGKSGGIMCMWDPNSFCKSSFTRSDYFVIIRCLWPKSGIKLMIVVVYAPQEASEKRMLWDYLTHISDQWDGEIVMMGDFNEVRYKSERFGSNFKAYDADIFNSFIHNAGLNEVHLGGSAFTWDAWNDAPGNKKNAIRNFMYKSKYTKEKIRGWLSTYRLNSRGALAKLKEDLRIFDEAIDKGNSPKCNQRSIRGIMVIGTWIDDLVKVKYKFLDHFQNRFDKPPENRARIDICFPNVLSNDQRDDLERMVTKEEVKKAAIDCFFTNGVMPNGCNSNFIALIPKIIDANMVKDFRPISLIGSLYKVIVKILTNPLANVIGDLINEVQSAFVAERQILDGSIILNEFIQWCRKKKKHTLIFKVDFEKAYDSVHWDFLDDILNKFRFNNKWRMWIQSCLRSSRGSILVNGSTTEEFQFFKGLKQDDTIFIGQWSEFNIDTLVQILECFYRASGLRINMCKSKIMGVNVVDGKIQNAASKLGCLVLKTPFTYLAQEPLRLLDLLSHQFQNKQDIFQAIAVRLRLHEDESPTIQYRKLQELAMHRQRKNLIRQGVGVKEPHNLKFYGKRCELARMMAAQKPDMAAIVWLPRHGTELPKRT
nr:RNA-directed DNA polymerase, eukaryota [Tanacetum cinerariifolium]